MRQHLLHQQRDLIRRSALKLFILADCVGTGTDEISPANRQLPLLIQQTDSARTCYGAVVAVSERANALSRKALQHLAPHDGHRHIFVVAQQNVPQELRRLHQPLRLLVADDPDPFLRGLGVMNVVAGPSAGEDEQRVVRCDRIQELAIEG